MIVQRVRRVLGLSGQAPRRAGVVGASLLMLLLVTVSIAWAAPKQVQPTTNDESPKVSDDGVSKPAKQAERKAVPAGESTKVVGKSGKAVRQIFRPTTTGSGQTSWTKLFESRATATKVGERKHHLMMVQAHRGDRWPVAIEGSDSKKLFEGELVDGDEKQIELKLTHGKDEKKLTLKLDKPETVTYDGRDFRISYGSTMVEGEKPVYVDHAHLMITMPSEQAGGHDQ